MRDHFFFSWIIYAYAYNLRTNIFHEGSRCEPGNLTLRVAEFYLADPFGLGCQLLHLAVTDFIFGQTDYPLHLFSEEVGSLF